MEKKYIIICQDGDFARDYNLTGEAHTEAEALQIIEEYKCCRDILFFPEEAKKVAAALWEKSFSNSDLSVVEILTAQEWRKKYFKDGGLVSFDELAEATTETLKEAINKYQQQIDILNKIASPTVRDFAEFSGLSSQIAEIKKILRSRGETNYANAKIGIYEILKT